TTPRSLCSVAELVAAPSRRPVHLAIHPGALGDVLLAVPALRALRAGRATVTLAAQRPIGTLLEALGVIDRVADFDTVGIDALFGDAPLSSEAPLARHLAGASRVICWFGARDDGFRHRFLAIVPDVVVAPPHTTATLVWRHLLETVGGEADCAPIALAPT